MCGIAGFWDIRGRFSNQTGLESCRRMTEALRHRGPDRQAVWNDPGRGLFFGHARLSILDLSPAGDQPMVSPDGRFVLVLNGEIYTFTDLRETLDRESPTAWRGHSDTEVLLAAIERWGLQAALEKATGMFALALWDRREQVLWLARDRIGEKPLYVGVQNGLLFFASELKALRRFPGLSLQIDREALAGFLRFCYVPAPRSIYQGIAKLEPGSLMRLTRHDLERSSLPSPRRYWDAASTLAAARRAPFTGSESEAAIELENRLRAVVKREMVSDVPLGAFLSGGIDSSTVVALMQAESPVPVKTFTIGFLDPAFNEAPHAARVARHLGTDHSELVLSPQDVLDMVPRLPGIWDEPFADSSQIPTALVAAMARRSVTVCLSGDGGDELFGGYNRHILADGWAGRVDAIPGPFRRGAARTLARLRPERVDRLAERLRPWFPTPVAYPGAKLGKLADLLLAEDSEGWYRRLVSVWNAPEELLTGGTEQPSAMRRAAGVDAPIQAWSLAERMMFHDLQTYLPDDILTKIDRACMEVGLESRVPFLDHSLVEFAWSLPLRYKIRSGRGKECLRAVLYKFVPRDVVDRPKAGFSIPLDTWLRGPLRGWAEALLDEPRLQREGFFRPTVVRRCWQEHLSGRRDHSARLWTILMFQTWLETQQLSP